MKNFYRADPHEQQCPVCREAHQESGVCFRCNAIIRQTHYAQLSVPFVEICLHVYLADMHPGHFVRAVGETLEACGYFSGFYND